RYCYATVTQFGNLFERCCSASFVLYRLPRGCSFALQPPSFRPRATERQAGFPPNEQPHWPCGYELKGIRTACSCRTLLAPAAIQPIVSAISGYFLSG